MANFSEHFGVGTTLGILAYAAIKLSKQEKLTLEGCLGTGLIGGVAASLPDLIEPASNPNHRAFFHSYGLGAFLLYAATHVWDSDLTVEQKGAYSTAIAGFLSHLALDSTTPKGLPVL